MIPQLNLQSFSQKPNPKLDHCALGSSRLAEPNQLNTPGSVASTWARVNRTISIQRPPLRRPPRARLRSRVQCAMAEAWAQRRVPSIAGQRVSPLQAFNASRAAAPGSRCLTCSRRPRSSRGGPEHLRRSLCCSCYLSSLPPSLSSFTHQ